MIPMKAFKYNIKASWILVISTFIHFGCSTVKVSPISSTTSIKNPGIIYALPAQEFDVVVTTEEKVSIGSPYLKKHKISDRDMKIALNAFNLSMDFAGELVNEKTYVIKKVEIKTRSFPDQDEIYFIETKNINNPFFKKVLLFELTNKGFLKESNTSGTDSSIDFILSTTTSALNIIASIYSPVPSGGTGARPNTEGPPNLPITVPSGQEGLYSILEEIRDIKQQKKSLMEEINTGKLAYVDLQTILKDLEKRESSLVNLFSGKTITTLKTKVFPFIPSSGTNILFNFDKDSGYEGEIPVIIKVNSYPKRGLDKFLNNYKTSISEKNKGIYYRIPANTLVQVYYEKKELYRSEHIIPQLGHVGFLPSRVGWLKNDIKYSLDPKTGALLKFDANGEGINLEKVESLQEESRKLSEKLSQEDNEFEDLEKAIKQLELENKLLEEKAKQDSLSPNLIP